MTDKELTTLNGTKELTDRDWDYIDWIPEKKEEIECYRCKKTIENKEYPTATYKLVRVGWIGQQMKAFCLSCKDF